MDYNASNNLPSYPYMNNYNHQHSYHTTFQQNPQNQLPNHVPNQPTVRCTLNCKCCSKFLLTGKACSCHQDKVSIGTQTDSLQANFQKEDYFKPKTSAYQFLQAEINRVVKDNKFNSTSDKGFESAVTCIVSFLSGLQHTPTTRDKVKQRVKKRIYNQQSYQKTKQIAEANGVSVKKCQSIAVKRNLTYPIETPPTNTKQPRKSSPVHSSPVLSSPDRSSPVRSSPVRSSPDRSSPVRSSPVRSSPDRASPVRSSPDPASPVSPSAVRSSPVHSSSVNLSAVRSSPVNSSPVNSSSSRSSPGQPVTLSSPEAVGSPETTKSLNPQDIISSPASTSSSVTTRVKVFKNSSGVTFHIQDTVCIARGKNSCDYAKVTSVWNTKVDITYLKKTAKGLKTWIVSHDKPYTDSVHINTIFFSFGKAEWSSDIHCTIKDKLAKLFE
ncbi:uncharacterized protein LOC143075312 [Mytilus galloprovincialis]|uniref:uncharacterized protein LOC143075312 n=1 Tax=Mytilus galloprovincialis TaxID=29158 RepID=UPI003F7C92F5